MGRDDFACVLSTVEGPAVAQLAAQKLLRALSAPFWIGDEEIHANPAIGIALCPANGNQADILLQRAKSACARARNLTGRIAEYAEDQDSSAAARLLYENRLRTAVSEDTLELVFQPQYDLRRGQVMGAEGLLRWPGSTQSTIAAEDAFAAAESADRVPDLVSSILNRALRNVSEFRYSAGLDLRIGIKLPARALRHADLVDVVQRAEIKIDVSAMGDLAGAPKPARILQSFIELAHHLKLDVVAVGAADEATEAKLKELGCDYMQADFKGPALDPLRFVERYGFNED
jgi:predicted signal transduction protein with EAL and GGDEF domain